MKLRGRIIYKLPLESGNSKNTGTPWLSQGYVLETFQNYSRKVMFMLKNDRVNQYPLNVGDIVSIDYDLDSREFDGRWYTDVIAWKVVIETVPQQTPTVDQSQFMQQPSMQQPMQNQYSQQPANNPAWTAMQAAAQGSPVQQPWQGAQGVNPFTQMNNKN